MIKQSELFHRATKTAAGESLTNWFQNLDPQLKKTLIRGAAGAAVGGATTGGIAAMTPRDKKDKHAIRNQALLGAILGGTGAAALPAGFGMLGNGMHFRGEQKKPLTAAAVDAPIKGLAHHPLTVALPTVAAIKAKDSLGALRYAMTHPATGTAEGAEGAVADVAAPALTRMREALGGEHAEKFWTTPHGRLHNYTRALKETKGPAMHPTRGRLAMIPAGLLAGYLADKYLQGKY